LVRRPWPNRLDTVGLALFPADLQARWAHDLVGLGSLPALLGGVLVVLLVGVRQHRIRAIWCAAAPVLAVLIVQGIAKPLVDRHNLISGGLSYPSGTVAAAAALATAFALIVSGRARFVVGSIGVLAALGTCAAVVVLRWHYPTDALGGLAVGSGSVLLVDAVARAFLVVARPSRPIPKLTRSQPLTGARSLRSNVVRNEWIHTTPPGRR
jgi:membrane-associated phospholipid phosphatase